MDWHEPLPEQCPPKTAYPPNNIQLYRILEGDSPSEIDFLSHRQRFSNRTYVCGECHARAVSLGTSEFIRNTICKFNHFRNKVIACLVLPSHAGLLEQNSSAGHYSWWRAKDFNPFDHVKEKVK
jgi:hypothetical protein